MAHHKNTTDFLPSLSVWYEQIGRHTESIDIKEEDITRNKRFELLQKTIDFPYQKPTVFPAIDLKNKSNKFQKLLNANGDDLCAIRLTPNEDGLPKHRNRGLALNDCYNNWFLNLPIDFTKYTASIFPHTNDYLWSIVFVVTDDLIFGEIFPGSLLAITTNGDTAGEPFNFQFDFKTWCWSSRNKKAEAKAKKFIKYIFVKDTKKQTRLKKKLGSKFSHGYIKGYFEALNIPKNDYYFTDYNRLLPDLIPVTKWQKNITGGLRGIPCSPGLAEGRVRIIDMNKKQNEFHKDDILVCDFTDIRYVPLMKKAAAIVTNKGGVLSHASIVARGFGIPCVVNTFNATKVLKDGQKVRVDGDTGEIKQIK